MPITIAGNVDMFSAGSMEFRQAYAGMVKDDTDCVEITRTNNQTRYVTTGTTNATAGGLYGAGTLVGQTLILSYYNTAGVLQGPTTITWTNPGVTGNSCATQAAALLAIQTTMPGVTAQIGGPLGNGLVLSSKNGPITIGAGTSNATFGLTAGTVNAQSVIAIDFGVAVAAAYSGVSQYENFCGAPFLDTDQIIGISIRDTLVRPVGSDHLVNYAASYAVRILNFGYIFAYAAEAVNAGDTVASITQGNGMIVSNGALGSIATGAAGVGRVALDGTLGNIKAIWDTTRSAGQIGVIKVR